ncbi:MAG: HPr family phosphocarrier protein [Lachnospiraceae bacterium]|nr:HPr family phosphocarrier protein [Lachnospiraceae bacterium]
MVKQAVIRLNNPEAVQEFVKAAEKCSFDIDVKYNRIIVDAKSFLGVMGLCSNPVSVCSHGEDSAFERLLEKFAIC